jgi:hypothetical protein
VDHVRSEGNPVVTDNCLFALNDGNCVGYAESSRACWNEVVVFDNSTDDGLDNVKANCEDMAKKRNAPFVESNDHAIIDGETGKVTTCGHRTNPTTKIPSRADHYSLILAGLEARGLEIGSNLEINSCGGLGDERPYPKDPKSEPYKSDELCKDLHLSTKKKVKVYTVKVNQVADDEGNAVMDRGFWDHMLTGRFTEPAPSMQCPP